jgi:hypothetical protein
VAAVMVAWQPVVLTQLPRRQDTAPHGFSRVPNVALLASSVLAALPEYRSAMAT